MNVTTAVQSPYSRANFCQLGDTKESHKSSTFATIAGAGKSGAQLASRVALSLRLKMIFVPLHFSWHYVLLLCNQKGFDHLPLCDWAPEKIFLLLLKYCPLHLLLCRLCIILILRTHLYIHPVTPLPSYYALGAKVYLLYKICNLNLILDLCPCRIFSSGFN